VEITVRAIVLRRTNTGEADRRLTLLTEELGKVDAVAKGSRKPASRLAGTSEVLRAARFTLAAGKRVRYVTQAQPELAFAGLWADYGRLVHALAFAELLDSVLPTEMPDPEVFLLALGALQAMELPDPLPAAAWAQVHLLHASGHGPQFDVCAVSGRVLDETPVALSPRSGGYVHRSVESIPSDAQFVPYEVAIGLARLADRHEPPARMARAGECLLALAPFWRHIAERPLPALKAALEVLPRNESAR
jgi:DNA repair protein RecO (recombination protein O)